MNNIGAALGWKHNHTPGICTVEGVITKWPDGLGPKPTASDIIAIQSEYDAATALETLRAKRDQLLHDTDWWASSDLSISEDQTTYRQALRDLPANTPDPANPTWPVGPGD